jgi:hypothetical protein
MTAHVKTPKRVPTMRYFAERRGGVFVITRKMGDQYSAGHPGLYNVLTVVPFDTSAMSVALEWSPIDEKERGQYERWKELHDEMHERVLRQGSEEPPPADDAPVFSARQFHMLVDDYREKCGEVRALQSVIDRVRAAIGGAR